MFGGSLYYWFSTYKLHSSRVDIELVQALKLDFFNLFTGHVWGREHVAHIHLLIQMERPIRF